MNKKNLTYNYIIIPMCGRNCNPKMKLAFNLIVKLVVRYLAQDTVICHALVGITILI